MNTPDAQWPDDDAVERAIEVLERAHGHSGFRCDHEVTRAALRAAAPPPPSWGGVSREDVARVFAEAVNTALAGVKAVGRVSDTDEGTLYYADRLLALFTAPNGGWRPVVEQFLAKYDECEPYITGAFQMAYYIRGNTYNGPNYAEELKALRALAATAPNPPLSGE